ncbi:MAG: hypothetical protein LBM62_08000 [Mediterranea sp.]|jgi:hypothetical protein|nr:hypothetical protein [Mediterranea sp.]
MNKIISIIAGLLCLFAVGCTSSNEDNGMYSKDNSLRLNYTTEGITNGEATTRANLNEVKAESGESTVNDLRLFFFEPTSDGSGLFVESYEVTDPDALGEPPFTAISLDFGQDSKIFKANAYVVLIVANNRELTNKVDNPDANFVGKSETDVVTSSRLSINGSADDESPQYNGSPLQIIPMSQRIVKNAGDETLDVKLSRLVSRIDVANSDKNYAVMSAAIWNAAKSTSIWDNTTLSDVEHTTRYYGIEVPADKQFTPKPIMGGLYAFSNFVEKPAIDDAVTTCLILGMQPCTDSDGDGTPETLTGTISYYRVNLVNNGMQYIKSNKAYGINVTRVRGKGSDKEKDALTQAETLLDTDVNNWVYDDNGSVLTDDNGNVLAVGSTRVSLPPEGGDYSVRLFTLGDQTLRISTSRLPVGIDVTLVNSVLNIHAEPIGTGDEISGFVEIEYGTLKATIAIVQSANITQYIKVTPNERQIFGSTKGEQSTRFSVASSGPWTATIYNDGFTFTNNQAVFKSQGVNMDQFYVFTYRDNTEVLPKSSFIEIALDDYPEMSVVLILTQRGAGGVTLTPALDAIAFDAFGNLDVPNFDGIFHITTDASSDFPNWNIVKTGASAADFTVDNESGTPSENVFTVSTGNNTSAGPREATVRVQLDGKPGVGKDIRVTQAAHTVSLNPSTIETSVPANGGSTVPILVTSSDSWEASITCENGTATLDKTTGASGESFVVTFDKNSTPLVIPTATITVKVAGTAVQTTMTVKQAQLNPRTINARQHFAGYSSQLGTNAYGANMIYNYLTNTSYFGSSGTVYTTAGISVSNAGSLDAPTFGANDGIYWENVPYDQNYINEGIAWKKSDSRNLLIVILTNTYGTYADEMLNAVSSGGYSYNPTYMNIGSTCSPVSAKEYSVTNNNRGEKLWSYVTKDGPFTNGTEIDLSQVSYRQNEWYGYGSQGLNAWPTTMIPLVMYNGKCTVGIDPTNNIVVLSAQLFNTGYGNYNKYSDDSPAGLFLKNMLAFMVNAAQYGSDFTDQYK